MRRNMKFNYLFVCSGAILFAFSGPDSSAFAAPITVDVVTTFVYPQTLVQTRPQKINDGGDIAGEIIFSTGETRGFARSRTGAFGQPIIEPNDDGLVTDVRAINNSRLIAGYYIQANAAHGFFLSGNTFAEFDAPGAINTYVNALNDAGDFGGTLDTSAGNQAYISIGGTISSFSVPNAVTASVYGFNNLNQAAGSYSDAAAIFHGFFRDADGTLTSPIDAPGSTQTFIFGINDRGWMVGRFVDAAGATHGLFVRLPNNYVVFDYPGATFTSLNGINRENLICGRYIDSAGVETGLIARVRKNTGD